MKNEIVIYNANERNLQIQRLRIPLQQLVVFEGPSGSGKSSLGIETILAEGQRRSFEALQSSLPMRSLSPPRPDVGRIEHLPPCFGMKQDISLPFSSTTSIADLVGVQVLLEKLFLSLSQVHCPETDEPLPYYSAAQASDYLLEKHSNQACSLLHQIDVNAKNYKTILQELHRNGVARVCYVDQKQYRTSFIEDAPQSPPAVFFMVLDRVKLRPTSRDRLIEAFTRGFLAEAQLVSALIDGSLYSFSREPYSHHAQKTFPRPSREHLQAQNPIGACPECQGKGEWNDGYCHSCRKTGLSHYSSHLKLAGKSFQDLLCLPLSILEQWVRSLPNTLFLDDDIAERIQSLLSLGLELPLRRRIRTLSTGERSRIRLGSVLNSQLGNTLYVLDEPSLGLDNNQVQQVITNLRSRIRNGHSFIVIDHHPLFSKQADQRIYFGPESGERGGRIVDTPPAITSIDFDPKPNKKKTIYPPKEWSFCTGGINLITGPSGAGKTTLLYQLQTHFTLEYETIHLLDKLSVLGNKRSCVATVCDLWTPIRSLLAETKQAKIHGLTASQFSFNRKGGRCETCQGLGLVPFLLPPLPPTETLCTECQGRRFHSLVLDARYRGQNTHELLESTLEEACKTFEFHPVLANRLKALNLLGLGYIKLGQPTRSLSGGEHRRIQLAKILEPCLHRESDLSTTLLLLDDPTAALHPSDAYRIQSCLLELRRADTTIILTSQNEQLLSIADAIFHLD